MKANLSDKEHQLLRDILTQELGVAPDQLKGEARIIEDLGADSLTIIEITMLLEERFNTSIAEERLEKVSTVDDLAEALAEAIQPVPRTS